MFSTESAIASGGIAICREPVLNSRSRFFKDGPCCDGNSRRSYGSDERLYFVVAEGEQVPIEAILDGRVDDEDVLGSVKIRSQPDAEYTSIGGSGDVQVGICDIVATFYGRLRRGGGRTPAAISPPIFKRLTRNPRGFVATNLLYIRNCVLCT